MFDYERIGKIFVDHKNKCYIWLKIETLNEMLIFEVDATFLNMIIPFMLVWIEINPLLI